MKMAIYARVSTERQEKQETIKSQIEVLRDYAKENNYPVFEEYADEGYSGELLDRPALDKLRDDAKKKLFEGVLVHSPDRLSRKFIYLGLVQEELKKNGINIIFLNRPDSKDTPEDNLLAGMQGLIAEYEKAKILERVRRGKLYKVKKGILIGSIAPYGYKYVKGDKTTNNGQYEIVEKEAEVVKIIFDLFVNKRLSIRAIAKELTHRNIPPRQGKHWRTSSLHRIIRNETYIGVTYYNKHIAVELNNHKGNKYYRIKNTGRRLRPRDQWIPIILPDSLKIIDKTTFALAQKQLERNSELSPRNVKYQYLLRGLVKCRCGSPFCGEPYHGKLFYRCRNRHKTFPLPRECKASAVKAENLEKVVWDKVCEAIRNPGMITGQIAELEDEVINNKDNIAKNIEAVEKELKDMENEENRILDAYREKVISIEQLKSQMLKVQEKKKGLLEEKQDLIYKQEKISTSKFAKENIQDYCKQIEKQLVLQNDFEGKRYLLSLAVNKIVLEDKIVRIKGVIPVGQAEGSVFGSIASLSY